MRSQIETNVSKEHRHHRHKSQVRMGWRRHHHRQQRHDLDRPCHSKYTLTRNSSNFSNQLYYPDGPHRSPARRSGRESLEARHHLQQLLQRHDRLLRHLRRLPLLGSILHRLERPDHVQGKLHLPHERPQSQGAGQHAPSHRESFARRRIPQPLTMTRSTTTGTTARVIPSRSALEAWS